MELEGGKTGTSMTISAETVHVKRDKGVGWMANIDGVWRESKTMQTAFCKMGQITTSEFAHL